MWHVECYICGTFTNTRDAHGMRQVQDKQAPWTPRRAYEFACPDCDVDPLLKRGKEVVQ